MKILCIGDPHIKIEEEDNIHLLIERIESFITTIKDINYIIILGDVLHNHEKIHTESLNLALKFFQMCKKHCKTYCLIGNHDATSNTIFLSDNHWMNICKEWNNFIVVDKPTFILENNIQIGMCPYVPDGRFVEAMNSNKIEWKNSDLIFAHQLFDGAKMGAIIAENVEEYKEEYPLCISGHIHTKQKIKDNLYYTGSSTYVGYGDLSKKYLMLLTLNYDSKKEIVNIKLKDVDLCLPHKELIYIDITNINIEEKLTFLLDKYKNKNNCSTKIVLKCDDDIYKSLVIHSKLNKLKDLVDKVVIKRNIININYSNNTLHNKEEELSFISYLNKNMLNESLEIKTMMNSYIQKLNI